MPSMKVVIVGAGTVGFEIAKQLVSENKNVVLLEKNVERAKYVSNLLDCQVINEAGNSIESLKKAGIENADFFISATNSDEVNMISCALVASEFKKPKKIARVRNLEYSNALFLGKPFLGADFIVTPEIEAAKQIVSIVENGVVGNVVRFEGADVQVRNITIDKKSFFNNKSLKEIKSLIEEEFLIASILRNDEVLIPTGETIIKENDVVYFVASYENIEKIFRKSGRKKQSLKRIVIVGGGRIGSYVSEYLLQKGYKITLVDKDYEVCKQISIKFPKLLVLNADISDDSIFEEEGLNNYDLFITTTGNQELNMLTGIYAKTLGVKRNIVLVNKSNYLSIASFLKIDSTVSPRLSSVDSILKFIRKGKIRTVYTIFNGKAEVIEFTVEKPAYLIEKQIKEIGLPNKSIVVAIVRNKQTIIPDGNFVIKENDNIIILTKKEVIHKIEKIFEG